MCCRTTSTTITPWFWPLWRMSGAVSQSWAVSSQSSYSSFSGTVKQINMSLLYTYSTHLKRVVVHTQGIFHISIILILIFRLKKERIKIHEQLAVSIILVQLVYLVGIDRTENRVRYTNCCRCMADCSLGISHCVLVNLTRFDSNRLCSFNVWVHGNTKKH